MCPAGTFTLIADLDRAHRALASYRTHLDPGGALSFTCHTERPGDTTGFTWRLRRTATDATPASPTSPTRRQATTTRRAGAPVVQPVESYGSDGLLIDTWLRRIRLRWWTQDEMRSALVDAGFSDVEFLGDDHDWLVTARATDGVQPVRSGRRVDAQIGGFGALTG